jgi:hypothetical protein
MDQGLLREGFGAELLHDRNDSWPNIRTTNRNATASTQKSEGEGEEGSVITTDNSAAVNKA